MSDITQGPPPLPAPAAPPSLPVTGEPVAFSWAGKTWGLAGLGFFNLFLTIITLGIYHFWAKTEVRRRLSASIRVNGEPLEYTGTGKELFLGFLIVLFAILLPFQLALFGANLYLGPAGGIVAFLILPFFWYLYGVAVYRARRYRRSRLRWRGVRGALADSSWSYGWHNLWTSVVGSMTYGWLTPWRDNMLHRETMSATRFGDRPFKYLGKAGPLYPTYALAWVGSLVLLLLTLGFAAAVLWPASQPLRDAIAHAPTLDNGQPDWKSPEIKAHWPLIAGLIAAGYGFLALYGLIASVLWSLFYAREYRYFTGETALEGLRFNLEVKGWSLFWLFFSNTLMSLLTLTILSPVAEARVARYFVNRLSSEGLIDFAAIQQSQARLSKTGEGLAEAFDVEANSYFILSI